MKKKDKMTAGSVNKKSNGNRIALLCCIGVLCLLTVIHLPNIIKDRDESVGEITHWYYTDEKGENAEIVLPERLVRDPDGTVRISTVLPKDFEKPTTLAFWSCYSAVSVTLDSEKIYSFDNSEGSFGRAPSSVWNYVDVPSTIGREGVLTVVIDCPYEDINIRLGEAYYGSYSDISEHINSVYGPYLFLEMSLVWIGVIFVVLAFVNKTEHRFKSYQILVGITLALFSIYLRTGTKGAPVPISSEYLRELIAYSSLIFLSVPLTLYIKGRAYEDRRMVTWCRVLTAIELTVGTALLTLHGFGVIDVHDWIGLAMLLLFSAVVSGIIYALRIFFFVRKSKTVIITLFSLFIIMIGFVFEFYQLYQPMALIFDTGFVSHICASAVVLLEVTVTSIHFKTETKKHEEIKTENKNLQLQIVTNQSRPHFILNTLGAIRSMIATDPERADLLLYNFSRYLRNNMEQKDYHKPVPFLEELEYIEIYFSLEKARFADRIQLEYDLGVTDFRILPLTIQPLVENAIKHGLVPSPEGGTVKIITRELEDSGVLVRVCDNGVGFDTALIEEVFEKKRSIGLRSTVIRLETEMGATVEVESNTAVHKGTCVSIRLPQKVK